MVKKSTDLEKISQLVCEKMNTTKFLKNPLFLKTIKAML